MPSPKHAFGLGLLLAIGVTAPALAQPASGQAYPTCEKKVSEADSEAAHRLYTAGKVDYDEANYDNSIKRFREAYETDCTKHELLVIISRAYEQKGDRVEAIRALETYLARQPTSGEKKTLEKRLAKLKEDLKNAPPPATASASSTTTATTAPPPAATPSGSSQPTPPAAEKSGGHTPYPWILVGVGGAAAIAGVVVIVTAPKNPANCDAANQTCTRLTGESDSQFSADQQRAGLAKNQPTVGTAIAIGGGVMVLGGLLWHFLEPTGSSTSTAKAALSPQVAPGYGGLSLGGSF